MVAIPGAMTSTINPELDGKHVVTYDAVLLSRKAEVDESKLAGLDRAKLM